MNQIRIAYVVNRYPLVSHTFIRREIHALEKQGFDILRISLQGWDAELADEQDHKERERTCYVLQKGGIPLAWALLRTLILNPFRFLTALAITVRRTQGSERSLPYHLIYLAEACRILPWIKSFGATHVHAHFGNNSAEVAMLAHVLGAPPYSFTLHGQNELLFGGTAEKVKRSAFVVAISSYGCSQLYRKLDHMLWAKVKLVHCGIDTAFHDVTPQPLPTIPRIVCVGRLCEAKGQLLLLDAAHRLIKRGILFELVLAGDGEMRVEVENLIAQYSIGKQVRITGWLSNEEVRSEILAARGLILPSFTEGLPIVIMEAMALRRPVLSTYVAGIPELVVAGRTGWLFPAGSVEEMTIAIEEFLATTTEKLIEMGNAAYLRVIERHSIETESAKLAQLFLETIQLDKTYNSDAFIQLANRETP